MKRYIYALILMTTLTLTTITLAPTADATPAKARNSFTYTFNGKVGTHTRKFMQAYTSDIWMTANATQCWHSRYGTLHYTLALYHYDKAGFPRLVGNTRTIGCYGKVVWRNIPRSTYSIRLDINRPWRDLATYHIYGGVYINGAMPPKNWRNP